MTAKQGQQALILYSGITPTKKLIKPQIVFITGSGVSFYQGYSLLSSLSYDGCFMLCHRISVLLCCQAKISAWVSANDIIYHIIITSKYQNPKDMKVSTKLMCSKLLGMVIIENDILIENDSYHFPPKNHFISNRIEDSYYAILLYYFSPQSFFFTQ